jgi:hypothetical protein
MRHKYFGSSVPLSNNCLTVMHIYLLWLPAYVETWLIQLSVVVWQIRASCSVFLSKKQLKS